MDQFPWAAVTKHPKPGDLKQQICIASLLWRLKPKIKEVAGPHFLWNLWGDSFSDSSWLPVKGRRSWAFFALWMYCSNPLFSSSLLVHLHIIFLLCTSAQCFFSYKDTSHFGLESTLKISFNLTTHEKTSF